jgi:hypothetical protein
MRESLIQPGTSNWPTVSMAAGSLTSSTSTWLEVTHVQ